MAIEVTMRHSDVRIESLKEYAEARMQRLQEKFPKVTSINIVVDVDAKKHMYMCEVVANRLGETAVGAKEFSESAKSVIDTAAARAERQLLPRTRRRSRRRAVGYSRSLSCIQVSEKLHGILVLFLSKTLAGAAGGKRNQFPGLHRLPV